MTNDERAELNRLRQLEAEEAYPSTASLWATRAPEAWNAVRKPEDAAWNDLPMEIKHKLLALAEKALAGKKEAEGDYAPEGFFAKVLELGGQDFIAAAGFAKPASPSDEDQVLLLSNPSNQRVGMADRRVIDDAIPHPDRREGVADRREGVIAETEGVELKGPLPEDFPGHAALAAEGVNTYHQLRKRIEAGTLTQITGIGDAKAEKIMERLTSPSE